MHCEIFVQPVNDPGISLGPSEVVMNLLMRNSRADDSVSTEVYTHMRTFKEDIHIEAKHMKQICAQNLLGESSFRPHMTA